MGKLILRRFLYALLQIVGASIVVFVIVRLLPADPAAAMLGPDIAPGQLEALRKQLGLDDPLFTQYVTWARDALGGDLGRSWYTSQPVIDDVSKRLPATVELVGYSLLATIFVLIPIGVISARKTRRTYGRVLDKIIFLYGMLAGAIPDFLLGILLIALFYTQLRFGVAPIGRLDVVVTPPPDVTGFFTIDSALDGSWVAFKSAVAHLILPVVTLTFVYGAPVLKMTRQTVKHMLDAEFTDYARAAGLSERAILRIALKNSLPPMIITIGLTFGYVIGGAVLVETVFSWGGFGQYAVQAISNADLAAVQGFVLVATVISILVYFVVDVLHYMLDPRVGT